jgi:outer membrane protein assembly factor BamB
VASILLVAGLTVGAIRVSAPQSRNDEVARLFPTASGTTWVYRDTNNGRPAGRAVVQITGQTVFSSGEAGVPVSMLAATYDDFAGFGPLKSLEYLRRDGDRLLDLGLRRPIELNLFSPAVPLLDAPLRPGRRWSWTGMVGDRRQTWDTIVVGLQTIRELGRSWTGCVHLRTRIVSRDDPASGTEVDDVWYCPGIGAVRRRSEVSAPEVQFEQTLVEFHSPGVDLVEPESSSPPPAGSSGGGTSAWGIGVDQGRSNAVPDAVLDTSKLLWSDTRTANVEFPPVGGQGVSILAENDGTVSAMDLRTGVVRWRVGLRDPIVAAPVLVGSLVIVADADKTLLALDAETGSLRWSVGFPDLVSTAPSVGDGMAVVATEDRRVIGLRLEDGETEWAVRTHALVRTPPAISGERVIVGDDDGDVMALGLSDGSTTWSTELDEPLTAGPAVAAGLVTVADDGGNLSTYDADTGELRWTRSLGGYNFAEVPPAFGAGRVVLVTSTTTGGAYVSAFDATDGRRLWRRNVPGEIRHAPMILGSRVAVLDLESTLWTFDLADGSPDGSVSMPRVLDSRADADSRVAMSYVDGALILTKRTASTSFGWAETTFFALSALPPGRRAPEPAGVSFESSVRSVPDVWRVPPVLVGPDLVLPGYSNTLWAVGPQGAPRSLATSDSTILFAAEAGPLVLVDIGGDLAAIEPAGGSIRWRRALGNLPRGTSPAVTGSRVLMPVSQAGVFAFDLSTGDPLWASPFDGVGTGLPLVLPDGDIVVGLGSVARVDGATGTREWSIPGYSTFGSMAYSGGTIFAEVISEAESALIAVDAASHAIRWKQPFDPALFLGPAASSEVVVAESSRGLIVAYDAGSGVPMWAFSMRSAPCGSPVIQGDRVIVTERGEIENVNERDYRVTVLDLATGGYLGSIEPPGSSGVEADCGVTPDGRLLLQGNLLGQLVTVKGR